MTKRATSLLCFALLGFVVGDAAQPAGQSQATAAATSDSAAPKKRQRVVPNWLNFDLLEKKGASPAAGVAGVAGATRGLPPPVALAPRLGRVYGSNPVFTWSHGGGTDKFVLVLSDADQQELFRQEVTGTQFQYSAKAPPLEPGKTYFWTVQSSLGGLGVMSSSPAGFVVVSAAQREEIEKALAQIPATDLYRRDVARARVFTDHRVWYDAIAAYSDLIARFPARAELYEQRGKIYAQTQATKALSEKDFKRADDMASPAKKPE